MPFPFRNGPIEDLHAGRECPTCSGVPRYSHISDPEMKELMKFAVDHVATLLELKKTDSERYKQLLDFGLLYAQQWDEPMPVQQYLRRD